MIVVKAVRLGGYEAMLMWPLPVGYDVLNFPQTLDL